MDDELKKLTEQESQKANFVPNSPFEEMIKDFFGVEMVLQMRENEVEQRKLAKRKNLFYKIGNLLGMICCTYILILFIIVITKMVIDF